MLERLWHRYSRPALVGGAVIFLLSNIGVVWLAQFQLNKLREPYVTTEKMRDAADSLLIGLLNAEVGVRGFLITGEEIYLGPYYTGVTLIGEQMRIFSLLPLDEAQRGRVAHIELMTSRQLDELANLVKLQREHGRDISLLQFQTDVDKIGLDTLKSSLDRAMANLSNTIAGLQRSSEEYQTISAYCVLFAAFWLYLIILFAANQHRDEE